MKQVRFTKFLEFTAQTGGSKAASALSIFHQKKSTRDDRHNYYTKIRTAIVLAEKNGIQPDWESFIQEQNEDLQSNFHEIITKFYDWKNSYASVDWFDPPSDVWKSSEFGVNINPELGLKLNGVKYAIKLYLNNTKLSSLKAQAGGLLMQKVFEASNPNTRFAIFDIKAGELHVFQGVTERLNFLLIGEAAHMFAIMMAAKENMSPSKALVH